MSSEMFKGFWQDNMRVRHMDWNDEESRLKGTACLNGCKGPVKNGFDEVVPMLDASETFDVILGSDILYEVRRCSASYADYVQKIFL